MSFTSWVSKEKEGRFLTIFPDSSSPSSAQVRVDNLIDEAT